MLFLLLAGALAACGSKKEKEADTGSKEAVKDDGKIDEFISKHTGK
jgi:hypothetical protein